MSRPALLISLLRWASTREPIALSGPPRAEELDWALESAMGPILHAALRRRETALSEVGRVRLRGADLLAHTQSTEQSNALAEILDAWPEALDRPALLKGSSLRDFVYPEPHWRLMGDLDLLVEPTQGSLVTAFLDRLGYQQDPNPWLAPGHHHEPGRIHPDTGVRVEVHTGLVPETSVLADAEPFEAESARRELRVGSWRGRGVKLPSSELQLVHLASHWAFDLRPAATARALLDALLLLRGTGSMDWDRLCAWMQRRDVAAHLALILETLEAHGLAQLPEPLRARWRRDPPFDPLTRRWLLRTMDRHFVRGVPPKHPYALQTLWDRLINCGEPSAWNWLHAPLDLAFPPGRLDRFRVSLQLDRRRRFHESQ